MDDARVGAALRAARIRLGWRQSDVAAKAGVSSSLISLIERGHMDRLALGTLRTVTATVDIRLQVVPRWRGGDLERLMNAGHEALREAVAGMLMSRGGWAFAPEVSFAIFGERGVVDLLAFHERTASLLVIELKTELASLEDLLATMDRRLRLAKAIARERGWMASTVSGWVVIGESDANRRRARRHGITLKAAFPASGHEMRAWLRAPEGSVRALSFWANSKAGGATGRVASRKRVRRPKAPAAGRQAVPGFEFAAPRVNDAA